jgi:hypothetical protein
LGALIVRPCHTKPYTMPNPTKLHLIEAVPLDSKPLGHWGLWEEQVGRWVAQSVSWREPGRARWEGCRLASATQAGVVR